MLCSTTYNQPKGENEFNVRLMRQIDALD